MQKFFKACIKCVRNNLLSIEAVKRKKSCFASQKLQQACFNGTSGNYSSKYIIFTSKNL